MMKSVTNRRLPHRSVPALVVSLVTAMSLAACGAPDARYVPAEVAVDRAPVFPTYVANDLNGDPMALPLGARSELTLVVVAFKRRHQSDVDRWLERARPLFADNPELDYVELPVLERFNRLKRWFIDRGMRSGIPDRDKRARVVTLYVDKAAFKQQTEIESEDDIHLFLVRRDGLVLWRDSGPATDQGVAGLASALGSNPVRAVASTDVATR